MLALYDKNNIGVYLDTKSVENQFDYNKIIIRNAKLTPMVLLHKKKSMRLPAKSEVLLCTVVQLKIERRVLAILEEISGGSQLPI